MLSAAECHDLEFAMQQIGNEVPVGGMWDALAPVWDRYGDWHATTTRSLTQTMVDALDPHDGDTVVELAGGPTADGAFEIASRLPGRCRLIVSDLSAGMLAAARRRGIDAGIEAEYRQLDVTAVDLADATVDRALARWVYMLLEDPAAAFGEARRVIRPGGRLVFAVFSTAERNPFFTLYAQVLAERGLLSLPGPGEPSMFALASTASTFALLHGSGFADVTGQEVAMAYRYADEDALWSYASEFSGPVAVTIRTLDDATRGTVRAEILERAEAYRDDDGYAMPSVVEVFTCQ